jgi:hypothetical protein
VEATEKVIFTKKVQTLKIIERAVPFFCIIKASR